jgi:hypothetical protein
MYKKELDSGTLLFVEVPNDGNPFTTGITAKNPIPDGFELLGFSTDLTEEQLVGIMEMYGEMSYKDYLTKPNGFGVSAFNTAIEAFQSLKSSLGLIDKAGYPKCGCMGPSQDCKGCDDYELLLSKVKKLIVLFNPKK